MPIETTYASGSSRGYGKKSGAGGVPILLPAPFTVTTNKIGRLGPTGTGELVMTNYVSDLNMTKQNNTGIFMITLTAGTYDMVAAGASGSGGGGGGLANQLFGRPAVASGRYVFTAETTRLLLLVGQRAFHNQADSQDGPGAGGTFICLSPSNSSSGTAYTIVNTSHALLVGGGGGCTDQARSSFLNLTDASLTTSGKQGSGGSNSNFGGENGYGGQHGCGSGAAGLLGNGGQSGPGSAWGGNACGPSTEIGPGNFTDTSGWINSAAFINGGMGGNYNTGGGGFGGGAPTGNNGYGGGGGYSGGGSTYANSNASGGGGSFAGNGGTNTNIVLGPNRNVSGFITITQIPT
jgi:hypothetical protein